MNESMSRRELLAWLAAGTGAAATGATVLRTSQQTSPRTEAIPGGGSLGTERPREPLRPTGTMTGDTTIDTTGTMPAAMGQRLLVVVEMPGGNDGLSMVVPYGDGAYYDLRSATAIDEADVLDLDGRFGLHPQLSGLHQRGVLVVDGVGSQQPDGSHFEMQARWSAGSSTSSASATGWIGRVADVLANGGADGTAALSVGSGSHPIIASTTSSTVSMPGPDALWAISGAADDDPLRAAYQRALRSFADSPGPLAAALADGLAFADRLVEHGLDDAASERLGYDEWGLGRSLQFAAAVLDADLGLRVVHVRTEGDFDTHEGHGWKYPELMRELDTNLSAFRRDLDDRGLGDRVMIMTTSEFGRTARENGSAGLDHGAASTMLLSGPGTTGFAGEAPSLTDFDDNGDIIATVPFESYLGGVIEGWLGVPASEVFDASIEPLALF